MVARYYKNKFWLIPVLAMLVTGGVVAYRYARLNKVRAQFNRLLNTEKPVVVKNDSEQVQSPDLLKRYYEKYGYDNLWSDTSATGYRYMLLSMLRYADSLGLNRNDYHASYLIKYDSLVNNGKFNPDSFVTENEVIFSDAAISFLFHVAYGRDIPLAYNGVDLRIDTGRIVQAYNNLVQHRNWRSVLDELEPQVPQYQLLKKYLSYTVAFLRDFPEADTLRVSNTDAGRMAAAIKLRFYGFIADSLTGDTSDVERMRAALHGFQRMHGIDTTGALDAKTVALLNQPLTQSVTRIRESLNYWRWTGRLAEKEFILVNIPAARLQIVLHDSAVDLSMRVIVGKPSTRTPQFTAYMTGVIAYPYWTVPHSIAVSKILPAVKRNRAYLDENNFQVLDRNGRVVNHKLIRWSAITAKNLPYKFRQASGCDNALGILKFDLNSPFSIYLHDTNRRDLFQEKDRFLSHGCVRVEKPMELANYVLDNGLDSVTRAKLNQCLENEKPSTFKLSRKIPVLIFYMTADVDEYGALRFYKDVYNLETAVVS
ncbi:MAG: L,D-transpeptidase family protein [Chitinophagales bacterium]|nr:L,D-transpeptidase family protein [Chitinophagales bacterium]MDW8418089.1 L,D-transpeptidase family protein [Chitinophagales bacterium]